MTESSRPAKWLFLLPLLCAISAISVWGIACFDKLATFPVELLPPSSAKLLVVNTLGLLASGLALICIVRDKTTLAKALSIIILTCALAALVLYLINAETSSMAIEGVSRLQRIHLSRKAISCAIGFFFCGSTILIATQRTTKKDAHRIADLCAVLTGVIGFVFIVDHLLKPERIEDWTNLAGMSLPLSISFTLLGLGNAIAFATINPPKGNERGELTTRGTFIGCVTAFVILWQFSEYSYRQEDERFARSMSDSERYVLKQQLLDEHAALGRAVQRYTDFIYINESEWRQDMENYIKDHRLLQSLLLVDRENGIIWNSGKELSSKAKNQLIEYPRDNPILSSVLEDETEETLFVIRAESPIKNTTLFSIRNNEMLHDFRQKNTGNDLILKIDLLNEFDANVISDNDYAYRFIYPSDIDRGPLGITAIFTKDGIHHLDPHFAESIIVVGILLSVIVMRLTKLSFHSKQAAEATSQVERESEDNQNRLTAIMRATPIGLVLVDADGRICLANNAMSQIFGYTEQEYLKMNVDQLVPHKHQKSHSAKRDSYTRDPQTRAMTDRDLHGLRKDGSHVPIEVGLNPVHTNEGQLTMATIVDITERKVLEDSLKKANVELSKERDEMEQLIYIVSHDLKSPLVTIQGFSAMLKGEKGNIQDPDKQSTLDRIINASRHMDRLIADILEFSRVGRIEETTEAIEIDQVIAQLKNVLSAESNKVNCEWIVLGPFPTIHANRLRIDQIFQNLISNALRYGCDKESNKIEIGYATGEKHIQLYVQDHGPGIEENQRERIFKLFQGTNGREGSTGVGLTIVRKVSEMYSGKVWVESTVGKGSKFIVRLPISMLMNN